MKTQRGSASLELALGVGLLLVPAALLVLSFGPWLERRTFVRLAAAEVARSVVMAGGDGSAGLQLLDDLAAGSGIAPDQVSGGLCAEPVSMVSASPWGCAPLVRGGTVTVTVGVEVPLLSTPFGEVGGLRIEHVQVEPVDLYRSLP